MSTTATQAASQRLATQAILFDLDGVLVKSEEAWFFAVEESGRRFRNGRAISREEFLPTFGQGTSADVKVFRLSCTPAQLDAFYVDEFLRHLDAVWVNPDAKPLCEDLAARGIKRALVTNSVGPIAEALLRRAGLLELFPVLATADRVTHAKPAPDLLQLALRELGVTAGEAAMVGDSRYDRDAAKAAGVRFIGLKIDGDRRVESLSELINAAP